MFNSIFKDCLPVMQKYAPLIATALGYPGAGAVAFGILNSVYNLTGSHVLEAANTINNSPTSMLTEAEGNFFKWANEHLPTEIDGEVKFKFS